MLRWGMSQFNAAGLFYGHGTDNAWDEALNLALYALHLPPDVNPNILDSRLTTTERRAIAELYSQRVEKRVPTPYLTRQAWFAGHSYYIDERALIPRSPLAELIERHFSPWIEPEQVALILDIGTGSACIAIACAYAFPEAAVDAVDVSEKALEVAAINVERHHMEEQVSLFHSDLFEKLAGRTYDVIISNPPYVGKAEMESLPTEYKHEPELALAAGTEGLDVVIRILQAAGKYLNPHGILIIEVGNSEEAMQAHFPDVPFLWLEFERGGGGVFLLTAEQLAEYRKVF